MNKELQNKAWAVLPKEFREEVKKEWKFVDNVERLTHDAFLRGEYSILTSLFSKHNLTSNTEIEEMLIINRKAAEEFYDKYFGKRLCEVNSSSMRDAINTIFGGKCRVGEDDVIKTETKFKVGDKIRVTNIVPQIYVGSVGVVKSFSNGFYDVELLDGGGVMSREEDLEPYDNALFSENAQNENNGNHNVGSENKQPTVKTDNQLRIMVAAEAMKGMLANTNIITSCGDLEDNQEYITKHAVEYADALIKEINGKGGGDERNNN